MATQDGARSTQIRNIEGKTGKSLDELRLLVQASGLEKHSEIRSMLQKELGLGYGDANALAHVARESAVDSLGVAEPVGDVLDAIYMGKKAHLRPIHERLMSEITQFGDFEVAPKKGYVSLRRKKQFAMIGPATNTRVELGLNMKGVETTDRLLSVPAGGMCQYKIHIEDASQVDGEVLSWVRQAFESAV